MEEVVVIFYLVYFLPTIIALCRKHQDWLAIVLVNLLLGWTIIGWIKALVWYCSADSDDYDNRGGSTFSQAMGRIEYD